MSYLVQPANSADIPIQGDYETEVALGNITGESIFNKFGRSPSIASGPQVIGNVAGLYAGQPLGSPETVQVFSGDAADNLAGTGAWTVSITGLKTNTSTEYESETFSLHPTDGTIAVTSPSAWWRVVTARVITAGSGGANAGALTFRHSTTTTNVFCIIPIGLNRTTIGVFTVPFSKVAILQSLRTAIARATGSSASAVASLRVRETGANRVYEARDVFELSTSFPYNPDLHHNHLIFQALDDITLRIESVSATIGATCQMGFHLKPA